MTTYTTALAKQLQKHYAMNHTNAMIMIEEEWEYIEERFDAGCSVKTLAQELVEIYMAA